MRVFQNFLPSRSRRLGKHISVRQIFACSKLLNDSFPWQIQAQEETPAAPGGNVQKRPSSKAAVILTRGAYSQYVSTAKCRERRWRLFSTFPAQESSNNVKCRIGGLGSDRWRSRRRRCCREPNVERSPCAYRTFDRDGGPMEFH